jgi:hypothetical protein
MGISSKSKKRKEEIEDRREKILNLQSMGYSQYAIIKELGITRMSMSRDMRAINESTKKGLFGLAKNETLSTYFYNCVQGINDVQKECWKIFRNDDNNPEINQFHKMKALEILRKSALTKFDMFTNVPGFMELERLRTEIKDIKEKTFDEKGNFIRHLTDEELEDLHKP